MLAAWDPPFFFGVYFLIKTYIVDPLLLVQSVPGPYVSSLPPNSVLDRWRGISKIDFELSLLLLCVYFVSPLPYRVCECVCTSTPQVYGRSFRSSSTQPFGLRSSRKQVCCCAMLVCHSLSLVHSWWWCFSFFFQGKKNKSLILSLGTCPQINH